MFITKTLLEDLIQEAVHKERERQEERERFMNYICDANKALQKIDVLEARVSVLSEMVNAEWKENHHA